MQQGTGCSLGKRQPIVTILFRLIVGLSYLTLSSCSNNVEEVSKQPPSKAPTIIQSSPSDGEMDFSVVAPLVVTFNKDLDPDSVNNASITVTTNGTAVISSVRYDDTTNQAIITPNEVLTHATEYTITLHPTITDQQKHPLSSIDTIIFTTTSKRPAWARSYRGDRFSKIFGIIPLPGGDYILYGEAKILAENDYLRWIARIDSSGYLIWQKNYPSMVRFTITSAIKTTDDNLILVGSNSIDNSFLLKLDTNGNVIWSKIINNLLVQSIQTTKTGFILVGQLNSRPAIVELSELGTTIWSNYYGDEAHILRKIAKTQNGGYLVAGLVKFPPFNYGDIWLIKIDPLGTILWQKEITTDNGVSILDFKATPSNSYIMVGASLSTNNSDTNTFVMLIDNQGQITWNKQFAYPPNIYGGVNSVQPLKPDGYSIVGVTDGKAWITKLTASGKVVWSKSTEGLGYDNLRSIDYTHDGGLITTGYTTSFSLYNRLDAWALKLDILGNTNLANNAGISFILSDTISSDIISSTTPSNQITEDSPPLVITDQTTETVAVNTNHVTENLSGDVGIITAPSNLIAVSNSIGLVSLSWDDNANNELGHIIYRSTDNVTFTRIETTTPLQNGVTSLELAGLVSGTTYFFKLSAYNADGYSNYSDSVSVTVN